MNKETYLPIENYNKYLVSNFGNIYSLKSSRTLSLPLNSDGYASVRLHNENGNKSFKVHQLVAMMFLGHKSTGQNRIRVVDHIDGDRSNNNLNNLRIVSPRENRIKSNHISGNTSKYIGVCWDKNRGKWLSSIKIEGVQKYLGRYDNEEEAANAYLNQLKELK
jgi:hypothetical protein